MGERRAAPCGGAYKRDAKAKEAGMTTIALVAGDPAGIGPELVAKVLANPATLPNARIRLIAQRSSMEAAERSAAASRSTCRRCPGTTPPNRACPIVRLEWAGWNAPAFAPAQATAANGAFMLDSLRLALDLAQRGEVDAVCFAPLNKAALRAGGMTAGRRTALVRRQSCTTAGCAANSTSSKNSGRRASPRTSRSRTSRTCSRAEKVSPRRSACCDDALATRR